MARKPLAKSEDLSASTAYSRARYPLHPVPEASGQPTDGSSHTTYDAASSNELKFEFWPFADDGRSQLYDPFTVDLRTHVVTRE